jgi:hypothetical protein
MTIGGYPEWSVKAAREKAKALRRDVDDGYDPLGERIAEREASTVNDLIAPWRTDHAPRKRERSRNEDESLIRQWIAPELGNRKLADIRRSDIDRLHRKVTESGTPVRANRAIAVLSKLFALAMRWELRGDNPASGIERNHEEARHRYLLGDELRRLTEALAVHPNQQAANAIRLAIADRRASRRGSWRGLVTVRSRGRSLGEAIGTHEAKARASGPAIDASPSAARRDENGGRAARGGEEARAFPLRVPHARRRWAHGRDQKRLGHALRGCEPA